MDHTAAAALCASAGELLPAQPQQRPKPLPSRQVRTAEPPAQLVTHTPHLILSRAGGSAKRTQPSKARDYSRVP